MTGSVHLSASTWQRPWPPRPGPGRLPVLHSLAERVQSRGDRRIRVAIDGRTAAGKTTLGHEIAQRLAADGRTVLRASLDDFKRPWSEAHTYDRTSGEGYYRNAYDVEAAQRLLLGPAAPGGSGAVALCSIDPLTQIDHSATRIDMPADGVLIVDGVFSLRPELGDVWDLRIWVEVDAAVSLRRGTHRDEAREGTDAAEAMHRDRYRTAEAIYRAEVDPVATADVIVDNNDLKSPRLLRS